MQNRWPEGLCLRFGSLVKKVALAAVMLMRPGSRLSPSWPWGTPETGYVDADRSCHPNFTLADGAGHTFLMGYYGKATVHGLRGTASTILNENEFNSDWIEIQLAHHEEYEVHASYNSAEYLPQRRKMVQ